MADVDILSRERAINGWMTAIAESGWRSADSQMASAAANLDALQLRQALGDKINAVAALQEKVAMAAASGAMHGHTPRERLFDGLMQGFDVLQESRRAVVSIWKSRDPGVALLLAGRAGLHLRRLGQAAGIPAGGIKGQARQAALAGIVMTAFLAWMKDESPDLSETMAKLDQLLAKAEKAQVEGVSPDLVGLPGLSRYFRLPGFLKRGNDDQALPPSPGLLLE